MKKILLPVLAALSLFIFGAIFIYLKHPDMIRDKIHRDLQQLTGTKIEIESFQIEGFRNVQIKTLKIMNPDGYEQSYLALLKDISIQMNVWKFLFASQTDIHKVQASLVEMNLERHPKGNFNLMDLAVFSEVALKQPSLGHHFLIERLELDFGKAVLYEYQADQEPQKTEVDFGNRREVYGQITDPSLLIYMPSLKIIPEFKRGSMGIPRTELQKRITTSSGSVQSK